MFIKDIQKKTFFYIRKYNNRHRENDEKAENKKKTC